MQRQRREQRPERRLIRLRHGLLIGGVVSLFMVGAASFRLFDQAQLWLSNLLYADIPTSGQVVIIAIDDLSLGEFGRSVADWSRERHARLISILAGGGARVISFDILFDAPTAEDDQLAKAITDARAGTAGTRVVMAVSGRQGTQLNELPDQLMRYRGILTPVEGLQNAGVALGHVNVSPDADGYVRHIPVIMQSGDEQSASLRRWLSLSAATYLTWLRIPPSLFDQVVRETENTVRLTDKRIVPVDPGKRLLTNFFGGSGTFAHYSFAAVYKGEINPALFKDKIVLVGALNATGLVDRYLVPIDRGDIMAGVEIHANALETLLQNRPLTSQPWAAVIVSILLVSFGSALLFIQLPVRFVPVAYAVLFIGGVLAASLAFSLNDYVAQLAYPALALTLTMIGVLFSDIQIEASRRRAIQRILDSLARLGSERLLLKEVLPQLFAEILALLDCQGAAIWLWDEEHQEPQRVFGSLHLSEKALGLITPGDSLEQPLSMGWSTYDLTALSTILDRAPYYKKEAAIIPLTHQGHPVGAIGAARAARTFTIEQLDLMQVFATNAAPILANARLYTAQLQQKELIESILTETPDPILVLGDDQRVIRTNEAARLLFPDLVSEVEDGTSFLSLLTASGVEDKQRTALEIGLNRAVSFEQEIGFGERHFKLLGAPLHINRDAWVLVLNDISTLRELDSLKTQMIRMASHDLKNPLGVVLGYTDLMLSGRAKEPDRFLRMIHDAAKRMETIINDILNIERLRAGRLDLALIDLGDLLAETFAEYQDQARDKAHTFTLERPPAPLLSQIDRRQFQEAISNLIGNAIKYTPNEGSVTVRLSATGDLIHLHVADNGYGMAKDAQANLFKPFYRVRTRETASIPGTGLGLSLVKAVIEAHGGRLWVESDEGKGSTFYIEMSINLEQPEPS